MKLILDRVNITFIVAMVFFVGMLSFSMNLLPQFGETQEAALMDDGSFDDELYELNEDGEAVRITKEEDGTTWLPSLPELGWNVGGRVRETLDFDYDVPFLGSLAETFSGLGELTDQLMGYLLKLREHFARFAIAIEQMSVSMRIIPFGTHIIGVFSLLGIIMVARIFDISI